MTANTKIAIIQKSMLTDSEVNIKKATQYVHEAAEKGANIIVLPELFANHYFCQNQSEKYFSLASEVEGHPFLSHFQGLAKKYKAVIPVSFYEKAAQAYYNSVAMINADGSILGIYRKAHLPGRPCYQEKYYFNPGDSGFKTWSTQYGKIGVAICLDQWFPECARIMALQGADLLIYPTALGSETPNSPSVDTKDMWQRSMIGHAVCNSVYLAAPNRIGTEGDMTFYGSSFVSNYMGDKMVEADRVSDSVLIAELNFDEARACRAKLGFFRDRRPDLYNALLTLDGRL